MMGRNGRLPSGGGVGGGAKGGFAMAWIREEKPRWANVISVMFINPVAMRAVDDLNKAITFGASALTRTQEEAIATAAAVQNECRF